MKNLQSQVYSKISVLLISCFFSVLLQGQQSTGKNSFDSVNQSIEWKLKFEDECTDDWRKNWFIDGIQGTVINTSEGMDFSAGSVERDFAHHSVLWTKDSFKGSVKIEYEYTKTDEQTRFATILYIQATGVAPFEKDIALWNDIRVVPSMQTYFNNMNALHISYASYDNSNTDLKKDYVRARKYPVIPGKDFNTTTEIPPASFNTGLFNIGETYKITVIKTSEKLFFKVEGKNISKLFEWELSATEPINEGRIGLRHMYTRSARYKNFKIFVK